MYLGAFEERETMLARRYLKAGMTVVDVGANVGYYTALAASIVGPAGRVFAIEPSPRAFCRLCELIRHNGIGQARAFQFGLSDAPGELPIYLGNLSNHTPTMIAHDALPPAATVPVATFDDCLEKWGLDIIDLLKIDIEGWEPKVFAGATSALRSRRIKAVLCEFNEPWLRAAGSSAISLWQILADAGFRPYGKQIKLPLAPVETAMLILGEDN
ncbi:MAG: FkbM family methyltransferase [Candidatus Binataceae bacterium]